MREFVDTNVFLYAYDPSAGDKHAAARELVGRLGSSREGVLSVQVLQEFYVNVTRKIAVPLSPPEAIDRLRVLAAWPTFSPTAQDVVAAAELALHAQVSFWDAMVVQGAAASGCKILWSEDLNSGQVISGVMIRNPFEGAGR